MRVGRVLSEGRWLIWLGATGVVTAVITIGALDAHGLLMEALPVGHTVRMAPVLTGLRLAFLVIALGALWRLRTSPAARWRWAVNGAVLILVCGIVSEIAPELLRPDWPVDPGDRIGTANSLEQRLLRLATMAAYAVPMLVVLAAAEDRRSVVPRAERISMRIAHLLVRWEPALFMVGVTTLATILAAAAMVHEEIAWALPIGADTTLAACGAAAIRARWRGDGVAFGGWMAVCISMGIGLLMGSYAFGGPFQPPAFVGDYDATPRTLLRDGHIMIMALGVAAIAAALARDRSVSAS